MQILTIFFLFILSLNTVQIQSCNITKEYEVFSAFHPKNVVIENTANTTANVFNNETLERSKVDANNVSEAKCDANDKKDNSSLQTLSRVFRFAAKEPMGRLLCISCYGSGFAAYDDECYSAKSSGRVKCADSETCYTELHPQYIKRGCISPTNINRTFVCKCPLCNDKPAADPTYYEYKTLTDWQFDNEHLEEPITGLDLLCKVCQTTGQNHVSDQICRNGSGTNYMLCGTNQLCFTSVTSRGLSVARGCVPSPVFNPIKLFCDSMNCNAKPFENPTRNRRSIAYKLLQSDPHKKKALEAVTNTQGTFMTSDNTLALKAFMSTFSIIVLATIINLN